VLGVIAIIAIQRAVYKILIAVFLTREYKYDETMTIMHLSLASTFEAETPEALGREQNL
jgi:hypothetical protein